MRNLKVTVNGVVYDVQVEEVPTKSNEEKINYSSSLNENIKQDSAENPDIKKSTEPKAEEIRVPDDSEGIKAPMPGTIIDVLVSDGQKVSKGQALLILEAMKMENEISSPKDGIVKGVNVSKGQSVDTGVVLLYIK